MPDDSRRWEQIIERTRSLLLGQPSVQSVELVGSRLHGTATELSDIDLLVDTDDFESLAAALPHLLESLEPLAAQWDRLSEEATYYMLVLPGAIKLAPVGMALQDAVDARLRAAGVIEEGTL